MDFLPIPGGTSYLRQKQYQAPWLRHSYGSYLANDKEVPLTYIRDELGHTNISTTSLYLNTDAKQRQKVVSDAFKDVESGQSNQRSRVANQHKRGLNACELRPT